MPACLIDACDAEARAPRGWCWKHYNRWRRYGDPLGGFRRVVCEVEDCDRNSRAGGMCDMHYRRAKRHGDPAIRLTAPWGECSASGCGREAFGQGLCQRHHYRVWIDSGGRAKKAASVARRRALIAGSPTVDAGLSWVALWESGHRDCHLCGSPCDPTDYRLVINRAGRQQKICGPRHPSLDHIIPLLRDGAHSTGNTALACMDCNRRKWASLGRKAQHGSKGPSQAATRPQ